MSSIYDAFRNKQENKKDCHDTRSAAFIMTGDVSNDITHVRLNKEKKAALIFSDKEGPDGVNVFTIKQNLDGENLQKGDYFTWNNLYFLVYEDVKLSKVDIPYIKQKAVECNVVFSINGTYYNGAFFSTMRSTTDGTSLLGSNILVSNEEPFVIIPRSENIKIDDNFTIDGKPWKIKDYDNITNYGISYLYLEKYFIENVIEEAEEPEEEIIVIENYEEVEQESLGEEDNILYSMTEYTFSTYMAYFASSPKVEILERTRSSIKFKIPYGIENITISTKNSSGEIEEKVYSVVIS
jgi:hypothetical protein